MVGARFGNALAVIAKDGSEALSLPSDTLIRIPDQLPALPGVPDSRPLYALKLAQDGLPEIEKVSESSSGSLAVGVKL